jgi:sugar phosphate permease
VIVAVAFLCEMVAFGTGNAAFSVFLKPMSEDLGWNRLLLSGAVTLQAVGNIVVSPVAGWVLDRHGPRMIMVFGATVATICFLLMGSITEPWQFYLLYTSATVLGLNEMGSLVTSTTVAKWFVRKRGRAMSLGSIGLNVGGAVLAPLVALTIAAVGWRQTWSVLGVIVACTVLPAAIFFFRRAPEDMGLLPDGDRPGSEPPARPGERTAANEQQWRLADALRNPTTWIIVAAFNLILVAASAMSQHSVAYLEDTGMSLVEASAMFGASHLVTIGAKLTWGAVSDRFPVRYCLIISSFARIVGLLSLMFATGPARMGGFIIGQGVGQGMGLLGPKLWADYYGRTFLGTIRGVLQPFSVVASLIGPLFAAYVFDTSGSYNTAFWVIIVCLLFSVVLLWIARPPKMPETSG